MDIFRLANDSLGVFNNRSERGKKSCPCRSDNTFGGDVTDSAVLSGQPGGRLPSYKAGPSLSLPYTGTMLPRQSRFGNFYWNHQPEYEGSVFQGRRRARLGPSAPQAKLVVPPQLRRPVQRNTGTPVRKANLRMPVCRPRGEVFTREPTPDIFAEVSTAAPQAPTVDWDGLWQN